MNNVAMAIGYAAMLLVAVLAIKPLLRGLSHGLFETVLYYKCGVSVGRVFKRFVRAVFVDFPFWGFANSNTTSITNNLSGWHGVFSWHFKKDFTRANSIKEDKANAAKRETAPAEAETESEEEPFEWDDNK